MTINLISASLSVFIKPGLTLLVDNKAMLAKNLARIKKFVRAPTMLDLCANDLTIQPTDGE